MGPGPEVSDGADVVLTELDDGFVVTAGSRRGRALLERLPVRLATAEERDAAAGGVAAARAAVAANAGVAAPGLPSRLMAALERSRWGGGARSCPTCAHWP